MQIDQPFFMHPVMRELVLTHIEQSFLTMGGNIHFSFGSEKILDPVSAKF